MTTTNDELRVIAKLKLTHNLSEAQAKIYSEETSPQRIIFMLDQIDALKKEVKVLNKALDEAYP